MATQVQDVMTADPVCVSGDTPMEAVAAIMRDHDIGDVIVTSDGQLAGIVTDRDLVTRGLADGRAHIAGDLATRDVTVIQTETPTDEAVRMMREQAVRRLPVCDMAGRPVGIVSIGDLAQASGEKSALADISAAAPNN